MTNGLVEAHALETPPARSAMIPTRTRVVAARERPGADAIALVQALGIEETLLGLGHEVGRSTAAAVAASSTLLGLLLQALVVRERTAAAGADVFAAVARRPTRPVAQPLEHLAALGVDRVRARPRRRLIRTAPTRREHLDPTRRTRALVAARRARVVAVLARTTAHATARRDRVGAGGSLGRERRLTARTVGDEVGRARAVRGLGRGMRMARLLIAVVDAAVELPAQVSAFDRSDDAPWTRSAAGELAEPLATLVRPVTGLANRLAAEPALLHDGLDAAVAPLLPLDLARLTRALVTGRLVDVLRDAARARLRTRLTAAERIRTGLMDG